MQRWVYDGTGPGGPVEMTADEIAAWEAHQAPAKTVLEIARAAKVAEIVRQYTSRVADGAAAGDQTVDIDDGSRANFSGMATTALAVMAGAITWPDSYARGWVSKSGVRLPLATPADGIALAAAVGSYYGALVQHEQDLLDAVTAAPDTATVEAIDAVAGWPS